MKVFRHRRLYSEWQELNCEYCRKSWRKDRYQDCEIESALLLAYFYEDEVEDKIASRMNFQSQEQVWRCPEFVPIETKEVEKFGKGEENEKCRT